MKIKRLLIYLGVIIIILFLGWVTMFAQKALNPSEIIINEATVDENTISIKGTLTDSATKYKGYKLTSEDNKLYIQIQGKLFSFGEKTASFDIEITNENYEKIYLQSKDRVTEKLIWSK